MHDVFTKDTTDCVDEYKMEQVAFNLTFTETVSKIFSVKRLMDKLAEEGRYGD